MTLVRASYEPDICPDLGPHTVRYALLPHRGGWKTGNVDHAGVAFNLPFSGCEAPTGVDVAAPVAGLELAPRNVLLSAWKRAENGRGWIVRFHENRGRACKAELTFPCRIKSAKRVNVLEEPLHDAAAPKAAGRKVRVDTGAHEIVSLRVVFG
jgi:alpha-mannosidase